MSAIRRPISSLTSGSDLVSKISSDSSISQVCAGNKAVYRITSTAGTGATVIPAIIPIKPPCCYIIKATWNYYSSAPGSPTCILVQLTQVNQATTAGLVGQQAMNTSILQTVGGNTLTYSLNPSVNFLDVTLNVSVPGPLTHIIEFEVFCNKVF